MLAVGSLGPQYCWLFAWYELGRQAHPSLVNLGYCNIRFYRVLNINFISIYPSCKSFNSCVDICCHMRPEDTLIIKILQILSNTDGGNLTFISLVCSSSFCCLWCEDITVIIQPNTSQECFRVFVFFISFLLSFYTGKYFLSRIIFKRIFNRLVKIILHNKNYTFCYKIINLSFV